MRLCFLTLMLSLTVSCSDLNRQAGKVADNANSVLKQLFTTPISRKSSSGGGSATTARSRSNVGGSTTSVDEDEEDSAISGAERPDSF